MKKEILNQISNVEFFEKLLDTQNDIGICRLFSKENIEITSEDLGELKSTLQEGYNTVTQIPEEELENFTGGIDVKDLNNQLANFPVLGLLSTPISNLGENRIKASIGVKEGAGLLNNAKNLVKHALDGPTETDDLNHQLGRFLKDYNGILSAGTVTVAALLIIIGSIKTYRGIKKLVNRKK